MIRFFYANETVRVVDPEVAVQAARIFRFLRSNGVTVRKTIDSLIAARCIKDGMTLLHSDRDFEPFVTHLGLQVANGFERARPATTLRSQTPGSESNWTS